MSVYTLFNELRAKKIKVWQENGQLKFKAEKGALTADLRQQLVTNKSDLIVFLQQLTAAKEIPAIYPVNRAQYEILPLSYAQERLWIIDQMDSDNTAYNIPGAVRIHETLDPKKVQEAFNIIIDRHDSLRTIFPTQNGIAHQLILDSIDFSLEFIDFSHLKTKKSREKKAKEFCQKEAETPFDITTGPLIRGAIIKLSTQEHILLINSHHIISDGWSVGVLVHEFDYVMKQLEQGKTSQLPALPIQYVDYSIWQREWLEKGGVLKKQLTYWQEKLNGLPASLDLFSDFPRPSVQSFSGAKQKFSLNNQLCEQLKVLTKAHGCTFYMTLVTAFKVLLYRYTGQGDICIGSPIANRQYGETEGLIGMFVNTLALRDQFVAEDTFNTALEKVKVTCLQAYAHQDIPFEKIVDAVQPQRNMSISPLFQIMVAFQNVPMEELEHHIELDSNSCLFDLSIEFTETEGGIAGSIEYCTDLYKLDSINRMVTHFIDLCQAIILQPNDKLDDLEYIDQVEKHQLLTEFNNTNSDYPKDKCIHQLFIEQVKSHPNNIAVTFEKEQLTYQALFDKSQDLALYLQAQGVKPDTLVGLCAERSVDMLVAILAIVQAGGAYVPLDPDYPDDRLSYMLEDCNAKIILTQDKFKNKIEQLSSSNVLTICLDKQWTDIQKSVLAIKENNVQINDFVTSKNLAYIIYTSGSTGQPKGVMVEHCALVNRIFWMQDIYGLNSDDVVLQKTPYSFDVSVWEFFWPLMSGASILFAEPNGHKSVDYLTQLINKHKVTTLHFVPSMLDSYLDNATEICSNVRQVFCSGEALGRYAVDHFKNAFPKASLHNLYGPTEAAIDVTAYACDQLTSTSVPIGSPIANTQIYILDQYCKPVPIGVPGELHIAGDGLARGYLNRPDLTKEKFIDNLDNFKSRLYKSGDLARWLPNGNIEYLGRIDTQVKIRGFRIELGEIEHHLNLHSSIRTSVVVTQGKEHNKHLVAFYVAQSSEHSLTSEIFKAYLLKSLPEYMVPMAFVALDAIPLTQSGKANRRILEQTQIDFKSENSYVAPTNNTEKFLVNLWAGILNLDNNQIGINDSFFELGGHSLSATLVLAKIRSEFSVNLSLLNLFEQTSVAGLAQLISKTKTSNVPKIVPIDRSDFKRLPLSFAQERLWFIDQLEPDSANYNIAGAVLINGELSITQLDNAFKKIIMRHDNLRTIFPSHEGFAQQKVLNDINFKLTIKDVSRLKLSQTRYDKAREFCQTEAATPFALDSGPLIKGSVVKLAKKEHVLLINMHHIISDGWSIGLLIKELRLILEAEDQGQEANLPILPIQYVDYSVWQKQWLEQEGMLEQQLQYWQDKLSGLSESLDMVTDYPRPAVQSFTGAKHNFVIEETLAKQLKTLAEQCGASLYMTLLSAFKVLLHRYTGEEDICIGSPIANRQYSEIENLVGMFVNTLALRSYIQSDDNFTEVLSKIKNTCLTAYDHQDTPFEKIVERMQVKRSLAMSPLFQIVFALQNTPEEAVDTQVQDFPIEHNISKFDLTIELTETANGLIGSIEYSTALYKAETIDRMARHYIALCQSVVAKPEMKVSEIHYIEQAEKQQLQSIFNNTQRDYDQGICVHQRFIEQAKLTPERVAIHFEGKQLSYAELLEKSQTLAWFLQSKGVKPDTLVGLCIDKSLDMIVGMLAILQAGGAYVPIDPAYPDERLSYVLHDSQVDILLTQQSLTNKLSSLVVKGTKIIALDRQWSEICQSVIESKAQGNTFAEEVTAENLAYVIYTSGTTGQPKGVMVEHKGLHSLCEWHKKAFNVNMHSKATQMANIAFDAATWEIWPYLTSSASLVIVHSDDGLDLANFNRLLIQHQISHSFLVTPMAQQLLEISDFKDTSLQYLLVGGDKLSTYKDKHYPFRVVNNYGPTETTVVATSLEVEGDYLVPSIGKPIANTRVYILDELHQMMPIGVPGELYIAGDGLARGYLNRIELTEEKFINNPYEQNGRMYKSGDRARWLSDGNIEYLGRIDTQVKIRGLRIETGEIEALLNQYQKIKESVVVAQDQGDHKQLIAFYVAEEASVEECNKAYDEALKVYLQQSLPEYMLPRAYIRLETIPLTQNGKVDRRVLENTEVDLSVNQDYLAPRNEIEKQLVDIYAQVLGLSSNIISVHANFFELGGHSLLATQLIAKIRLQLDIEIPLKALFDVNTLADTAEVIAMIKRQHEQIKPVITESSKYEEISL